MDPALHCGLRSLLRTPVFPCVIGALACSLAGGVLSNLSFSGVVGSVVRTSTGLITVTFASSQPDLGYAVVGCGTGSASVFYFATAPTVDSFQFQNANSGGALDSNFMSLAILR